MDKKPTQREPTLLSLSKLNSLAKSYIKQIPYQICEICFHPLNLIICSFCKNNYHPKCLHLTSIPSLFVCPLCKAKLSNANAKTEKPSTSNSNNLSARSVKEKTTNRLEPFTTPLCNNKRKREETKSRKKETKESASHRKKGIEMQKKERENRILLSYEHSNPQYKRRKIKIGLNHNVDMYEFTDKYENKLNFDEEEYERGQLKQVWSSIQNPLSEEEINEYVKTARLFWTYRNMFLENELCADFFEECDKLMKGKKMSDKLKERIHQLIDELKGLVRRGVDLNCHYDEMALKMLHMCGYKTKVALLFLYKQLNPFIEEAEEGFKNDVLFFQSEIVSIINDGDFYIEE